MIAMGAYGFYFFLSTSSLEISPDGAGMAWVKKEFDLSESEFTSLKKAHDVYAPRCEKMCRDLEAAKQELATLIDSGAAGAAAIVAAHSRVHDLEGACLRMSLLHIHEVSELMGAESGERYRREMVTKLLEKRGGDHHLIYNEAK